MKQPPDARGHEPPPRAAYANYFQVGQNACEVVLDFGYAHDEKHVVWVTRIVTTPQYAKALLQLLDESLEQHEARYGPLDEP
jgi:hypothetical protein